MTITPIGLPPIESNDTPRAIVKVWHNGQWRKAWESVPVITYNYDRNYMNPPSYGNKSGDDIWLDSTHAQRYYQSEVGLWTLRQMTALPNWLEQYDHYSRQNYGGSAWDIWGRVVGTVKGGPFQEHWELAPWPTVWRGDIDAKRW